MFDPEFEAAPSLNVGAVPVVTPNPWAGLRELTAARIALGRAGVSLPTAQHLAFQQAHAQARDAVHAPMDVATLAAQLQAAWPVGDAVLQLHSAAADRAQYLQRPDLGRRLGAESARTLASLGGMQASGTLVRDDPQSRMYDLAFVVADGLSARAVASHAAPFLSAMRTCMSGQPWRLAPLCIVRQGRVAVGDEIGQRLSARMVVVLIGERPGLSSPDSMGLYMSWMPRVGLTDANRNCISNVRPAGLPFDEAARKLRYLLGEARQRQLSGVELKDETAAPAKALDLAQRNFLLR